MHDPIAYTYEADYHCERCTVARFGSTEGVDNEGNEVGAVAPWDEWWNVEESGTETLHCSDCHAELDSVEGSS